MNPSVQALRFLAERLGLPIAYFLDEGQADPEALAPGRRAAGLHPTSDRQQREEAALLMLTQAEGRLRLHQPEEALQVLQVLAGPPDELPRLEQPRWYWLAGWALQEAGRSEEAVALCTCGLALAEEAAQQATAPDRSALVELAEWLRCALGTAEAALGQVDLAVERHQQGWDAVQAGEVTDPTLALQLALALGQDYLALGRSEGAQALYEAAQPLLEVGEDPRVQAQGAWERAQVYKTRGQLRRASHALVQALAGGMLRDAQLQAVQVQARLGNALLERQDYALAERLLRQSLVRAEQAGDEETRAEVLHGLARLFLAQGNASLAMTTAEEGLLVAAASGAFRVQGQLFLTLAAACEAHGQAAGAEAAYQQALNALEQMTKGILRSEAHERYGQFLQRQRRFEEAFQHMRRSLDLLT
jgi:tetratricopeptide (TPR) repeat protein